MNLLVDTNLLLWAAGERRKLSKAAREMLNHPSARLWYSVVSIWEVSIKSGLGRDDFRVEPRRLRSGLLANDWRELAVSGEHALAIRDLPPIHKDPFDRMLLAQSHVEGIPLITSDEVLTRYPGQVRKV